MSSIRKKRILSTRESRQRLFILVLIFSANLSASEDMLSYKFGQSGCGDCGWFVVVDGVMGGLSTAKLEVKSESAKLSGTISLANNGGFSSIRTPNSSLDLSSVTELKVRYRSQGQNFAFTLNNNRQFWMPRFKALLPNTNGNWLEIMMPLNVFTKMRFDEVVGGAPSKSELAQIIRLGLISNDKKDGKFYLELDYIEFL